MEEIKNKTIDDEFIKNTTKAYNFINCKFNLQQQKNLTTFINCEFNEISEKSLRENINRLVDELISELSHGDKYYSKRAIVYETNTDKTAFTVSVADINMWQEYEDLNYQTAASLFEWLTDALRIAVDNADMEQINFLSECLTCLSKNINDMSNADMHNLYISSFACYDERYYLLNTEEVIKDWGCYKSNIEVFLINDLIELKDKNTPLENILQHLPKLDLYE